MEVDSDFHGAAVSNCFSVDELENALYVANTPLSSRTRRWWHITSVKSISGDNSCTANERHSQALALGEISSPRLHVSYNVCYNRAHRNICCRLIIYLVPTCCRLSRRAKSRARPCMSAESRGTKEKARLSQR